MKQTKNNAFEAMFQKHYKLFKKLKKKN